MFANMKAALVHRSKTVLSDGSIIEMVVWQLPGPVLGSTHGFKYRLYFGREGRRLVGNDNERGKGDHKHVAGRELDYVFSDVETLMADFLDDVRTWRKNHG